MEGGYKGVSKHIEHAELGLAFDLPALRTRDVDAFYAALRELEPNWRRLPLVERASAFVRAAARCGWLAGVAEAAVGDWPMPHTLWVAGQVDAHFAEALAIPKAPSPSPLTPTSTPAASAPPN